MPAFPALKWMKMHGRRSAVCLWPAYRGKQGGQSLVELAIILPVLILILVGIMDLGRVFYAQIVITNAAREGARYGSMYPMDIAGIKARAIAEAQGAGIQISPNDVQVSGTVTPGEPLTVTVTYRFAAITTLISSFWGGGNLPLQGQATMVIQ